jgi:hypothetical protein
VLVVGLLILYLNRLVSVFAFLIALSYSFSDANAEARRKEPAYRIKSPQFAGFACFGVVLFGTVIVPACKNKEIFWHNRKKVPDVFYWARRRWPERRRKKRRRAKNKTPKPKPGGFETTKQKM